MVCDFAGARSGIREPRVFRHVSRQSSHFLRHYRVVSYFEVDISVLCAPHESMFYGCAYKQHSIIGR